jgi:hypothetical protein
LLKILAFNAPPINLPHMSHILSKDTYQLDTNVVGINTKIVEINTKIAWINKEED